jgi:drug/metabolite transporter (DMT)-like permease
VGAGRALVVTYVNPVVAITLGMIILGDRPGIGAIIGLLLILGGSWLATGVQFSATLVSRSTRKALRPGAS